VLYICWQLMRPEQEGEHTAEEARISVYCCRYIEWFKRLLCPGFLQMAPEPATVPHWGALERKSSLPLNPENLLHDDMKNCFLIRAEGQLCRHYFVGGNSADLQAVWSWFWQPCQASHR
jgi:hypothetical protein